MSVAATFSLTLERVEKINPMATDILRICSMLHAEAIPEEIFQEGAAHLGPRLAANPDGLDEAVGTLSDYSLVQRSTELHTLTVHRLVQAVLRDAMKTEETKLWAERTVLAVNTTFPYVEFAQWLVCERCLPHALACAELVRQRNLYLAEAALLLQQAGWYIMERGRYREAEPLLEQALAISEQVQGKEHLDTARNAGTLGLLYDHRGKYKQAEPLFQQAIAIHEKQLGSDHPEVATSLNNLALLYDHQGKYEQAEPLFQLALTIREKQLGPDHPHTANSLNNLAFLYDHQGKYEQAEPLLMQALAICRAQGKYEQAEPLYQRTLAICEQQLGLDHPDTAGCLNNLAALYQAQGKYGQAEPLFQRALAICEQQLGTEHPSRWSPS
jgi:tetratricopeptide (TPR) repeat protein